MHPLLNRVSSLQMFAHLGYIEPYEVADFQEWNRAAFLQVPDPPNGWP